MFIKLRSFELFAPLRRRKRWFAWSAATLASAGAALAFVFVADIGGEDAAAFDKDAAFEQTIKYDQEAARHGPLPLTPVQCASARKMLDSSLAAGRTQVAGRPEIVADMEAEFARSFAWVDAGCPPDAVRGFYPFPDGRGGELRLLVDQPFSRISTFELQDEP